jgi:hypothetical protein
MHLHRPPLALLAGVFRCCAVWISSERCRHVTAGMRVAREFSDVPFRTHFVHGPERPKQISPGNRPGGPLRAFFASLRLRVSDPGFELRARVPADGPAVSS